MRIHDPVVSELSSALAAVREGDLDAAGAIAQRLVQLHPDDPAVLQLLAEVALRRGDAEQAKRSAAESLARRPDHVPTLLLAGRAACAAQNLPEAAGFLRRATSLAPDRADAAFLACATLLELGDPAAGALLTRLLDSFPDDSAGWSLLGSALQRAGKMEAALAAFTRVARASPSFAPHLRCGELLESLGRFGDALDAYRAAMQMAPENGEGWLKIGLCLRRFGEIKSARTALEQAVKLSPASSEAWFALGLVRQDQREHTVAADAYRRALDIRPELAEAAVNLGICYQVMGDLPEAKALYRRALELRPDSFGRIAQALSAAPVGEVWLDVAALRGSLTS
jgi:tetratricopeptide (TPR) repeat protein